MTTPDKLTPEAHSISTAFAILAAALPAPTTSTRPLGGEGKKFRRDFMGLADSIAMLKQFSKKSLGSFLIFMICTKF